MSVLATESLKVGDRLGPLRVGTVTRTTLALFAGGSGDHNPIHLDIEIAKSAGMGDVFAQGMLGMAYLGRLLTDAFGQSALVSYGVRFTEITPINAEPICTGEVTAIEDGVATLDLKVELADGTVTLLGNARVKV